MKDALWIAQEKERVDSGNQKRRSYVSTQHHVDGFVKRRRIQHCHDRIDVDRPPVNNVKPGRRIHPGVCQHDEHGGENPKRSPR